MNRFLIAFACLWASVSLPIPVLAASISGQGVLGGGGSVGPGPNGPEVNLSPSGIAYGNINFDGFHIVNNGTIDPGVSPNWLPNPNVSKAGPGWIGSMTITGGNLTMNTGSHTNFDIQVGNADLITVTGGVNFVGGAVNLTSLGSGSFAPGTFTPLLSFTSTNLPDVGGLPYLRLGQTSSQSFTVFNMSGEALAAINLPAVTVGTGTGVLIPTLQGNTLGVQAIDTAKIMIELRKDNTSPVGSMSALATASTATGIPITMGVAAAALGYDHFNYMQFITHDTELEACVVNPSTGCASLFTMSGAPPALPTSDAPFGGWAYQGATVGTPARDFWPFYYDEYFKNLPPSRPPSPPPPSPLDPGYLDYFTANGAFANLGQRGLSPDDAMGFIFSDQPSINSIIDFKTALVGVKGTGCNQLGPSTDCSWDIIRGTTFAWSDAQGVVSFSGPRENPIIGPDTDQSIIDRFSLLSQTDLINSLISVDQFLDDIGLTPDELIAMGGGISDFSASVVGLGEPSPVPEPSSILIFLAGLAGYVAIRRRK